MHTIRLQQVRHPGWWQLLIVRYHSIRTFFVWQTLRNYHGYVSNWAWIEREMILLLPVRPSALTLLSDDVGFIFLCGHGQYDV